MANNALEAAYERALDGEEVSGTVSVQGLNIEYETQTHDSRWFVIEIEDPDGGATPTSGPAIRAAVAYVLESMPDDIDQPLPDPNRSTYRCSIEL